MKFEYLSRVVVEEEIEIEDVGNCAILANDDFANYYGLVINTVLGTTKVFEFGPVTGDKNIPPENSYQSITTFTYDVRKCNNHIDKFLNNPRRGITQAFEKEPEEVFEYAIDLSRCINGRDND